MTANKKHALSRVLSAFSAGILLLCAWSAVSLALTFPGAEKIVHQTLLDQLSQGGTEDVIVVLDETDAAKTAAALRAQSGVSHDTQDIVMAKASMYRSMKTGVFSGLSIQEVEAVKDYDKLPVMFVRVKSLEGLKKLAALPGVKGIYKNREMLHMLTQSLPLIGQPAAAAAGFTGSGTSVAVIDGRVDYTNSAFGCGAAIPPDCTSGLSSPPGCKIACVHNYVGASFDDHSTNVSAIVSGVAPGTRIVGLTVFDNSGRAWDSDILAAINWAISNKDAYHITAINLSLGDPTIGLTATCPGDSYAIPVANARSAGILSAIAAGNETRTNALSSPACVPAAVSVGAVYDANLGYIDWGDCIDATTAPDKIACFSNNASFLTVFAPGCDIMAAGISMCGTSMSTPHVAGAIAVLRSGFPTETVGDAVNRMVSTGKSVTDSRDPYNPITKPRLDLSAAVSAANSISGMVQKPSGEPLAGVTMTLSGPDTATTVTSASGTYSFADLAGGTYTVQPGSPHVEFSPSFRTVAAPASGVNFTALTYKITGHVYATAGSSPLSGVTVSLTGDAVGSAITGADGAFTFNDLKSGSYKVTPTRAGFNFAPAARNVTISGADQNNVTFVRAFIISGHVRAKKGSLVFPGVTVTLSGASSAETVTDTTGSYQFAGLIPGSYAVTPKKLSFVFSPVAKSVSLKNKDAVTDFKTNTYSISGTVKTAAGAIMSGVSLSASGCDIVATAVTDSKGKFKVLNLPSCSYIVSPSDSSGHIFSPVSAPASVNNTNISGISFSSP